MSKKIQKRDAEASKKRIMKHAIELFSKKGYASSSMDELAKLCGLNKAMVFYYFKNKKGLYESVISEVLIEIQKIILEENQKHDMPREQLEGFIYTYARFTDTHPYLPSLLLRELSDSGAVIPKTLFVSMRQLFALFSDILKRGEREGVFIDAQPMILYFMVIGTLNLMVTTKSLREQAGALKDINIDTCGECEIDVIASYLVKKIFSMLTNPNIKDA
ncbi:MAG TPA: TetR/AcrR family transcriptional regulator [Epsilonproteobacteria bacterium]|nr:TetR/AcrR family transcriptional regulator [Campylobacterota bacterium]